MAIMLQIVDFFGIPSLYYVLKSADHIATGKFPKYLTDMPCI